MAKKKDTRNYHKVQKLAEGGPVVKDQTRYGDAIDDSRPYNLNDDRDNEYEAHYLLGPLWKGAYPEQKKSTVPSRRQKAKE